MTNISSDREILREQVYDVLASEEDYLQTDTRPRVGVESEYFILDPQNAPVDREQRNRVAEKFDFARKELGESTIELITEYSYLTSLQQLRKSITLREDAVRNELGDGFELVRNGVQPFSSPADVEITSDQAFESCMDYYSLPGNQKREIGEENRVELSGPQSAGLICAIHTNLEAHGFKDAIKKANYTYMISPYLSAVSGNARFINGKDTGLSDLRMILWRESHGSEEKIGLVESYYDDMEDYLERVVQQEFIPEGSRDQLEKAISHFWKDSRIKLIDKSLVVESRIPSIQPTVEEDVAVHGFYIGRIMYAIDNDEDFMDIEKVNENRERAMKDGLDSELHAPGGDEKDGDELLLEEIQKARKGLEESGIEAGKFLDILEKRAEEGVTPSKLRSELYRRRRNGDSTGKEVIRDIIKTASDQE